MNNYSSVFSLVLVLILASCATGDVISGPIFNPVNNHTYYLLAPSTWNEAESEAVSLGGHLVTINDQDEQDWVFDQFGGFNNLNYSLWIGLNDEAVEGQYVWSSGEVTAYTNWAPNKPDNSTSNDPNGEDYIHMFRNSDSRRGQWNDIFADVTQSSHFPFAGVVEVAGVPEPGTGILTLMGLAVVLRRRRT